LTSTSLQILIYSQKKQPTKTMTKEFSTIFQDWDTQTPLRFPQKNWRQLTLKTKQLRNKISKRYSIPIKETWWSCSVKWSLKESKSRHSSRIFKIYKIKGHCFRTAFRSVSYRML